MMSEQTYTIFTGDDTTKLALKPTSNQVIRRVCTILTQCHQKPNHERVYYAEIGDIAPESFEEDGGAIYNFKNYYTNAQWMAALVPELFFDGPQILRVDAATGKVEVADQELFDKLNREVVWRAFDHFLGKFGENLFEVGRLFNTLSSGLDSKILQTIMNPGRVPEDPQPAPSTSKPSGDGET